MSTRRPAYAHEPAPARVPRAQEPVLEPGHAGTARAVDGREREPTGSLDAASAQGVLAALLGTAGVAVLVVTHDPEVAARAARTLRMSDGKLVSEAP